MVLPPPLTSGDHWCLSSVTIVLSFPECPTNGITQHVTFWDGLFTSHNASEIHPCCCCVRVGHSFLLPGRIPLDGCIGLFIHSPMEGHFGYFQLGITMNTAAITLTYKFLCEHIFSFLEGKWVMRATTLPGTPPPQGHLLLHLSSLFIFPIFPWTIMYINCYYHIILPDTLSSHNIILQPT